MLNSIDAGLNLGVKTVELIDTVIQKIEKYTKLKQDETAYLRILYLEVVNNLEVLKTINFDKYSNIKPNNTKVKTIVNLLQTEISESIFYKSSESTGSELYNKLMKKGKVDNKGNELLKLSSKGEEIKVKQGFVYENVLQAISFVVTKIELMRKYSNLQEEELEILKVMNCKSRLININQRLIMIKKVMDEFEDIKDMAR